MTTVALAFNAESQCTGTGNFSKYVDVSNFAGLSLKETEHSKQGRLIYSNTLSIDSRVRYVYIDEMVSKNSMLYEADINASMPTALYNRDDLYYRGSGMDIKSAYINNNDKMFTRLSGNLLTRSVKFGGIFNEERVLASIAPGSVDVHDLENRTFAFALTSSSDRSTGLRFVSGDEFIDQNYVGRFQLNTKLLKGSNFIFLNDTVSPPVLLPCCVDDWESIPSYNMSSSNTPSYDQDSPEKGIKEISNCTCSKVVI
ncbi:MAG: hypothetical protein ACE14P_12000 [Methanotrichaceae archaeon]